MNKGFTLIELLVVVLIIGILAAIALPQYQKAVERSRMAEAVQVLGDLATAQSIYYMQHNVFAEGFSELNEGDINIADPSQEGKWRFDVQGGTPMATAVAHRSGGKYADSTLAIWVWEDGRVEKLCEYDADNETQEEFCDMAVAMGYTKRMNIHITPGGFGGGGLGPLGPHL